MMRKLLQMGLVMMLSLAVPAKAQDVQVQHDGKALNGRLAIAEGKGLHDGVLIITHGTLAHMDMELIATMQNLLAERGVSSLIHSLSLGVDDRKGMYDCAVPFRGTIEGDNAELGAWVAWLESQGASSVSIMGHSRGAVQVAKFAATPPAETLERVVMLAPSAGSSYEKQVASYGKKYDSHLPDILAEAKALVAEGKGAQLMNVPAFMYCENAQASAEAIASYYRPEAFQLTSDVIAKVDLPVLIVVGDRDDVVGDVAARLADVVDGDMVQLTMIEDAGHFFYDFAAEDAADAIAAFLARPESE